MQTRVRFFQAIEDASIEIEGITLLIGVSGGGKSAFLRALRCACFGVTGSDFVKHGHQKAQVGIKFDDNLTYLWEKGDGGASFLINGKPYEKGGRKGAQEVLSEFGVSAVETKVGSEELQYWKQLSEPFLVFASSSHLFVYAQKLLASDYDIPSAVKLVMQDLNKLNVEAAAAEAVIKNIQQQANGLGVKYKVGVECLKKVETYEEVGKRVTISDAMTFLSKNYRTTKESCRVLYLAFKATSFMKDVEEKSKNIASTLSKKSSLISVVKTAKEIERLSKISDEVKLPEKDDISTRLQSLVLVKSLAIKIESCSKLPKEVAFIDPQDQINKALSLRELSESLKKLNDGVKNCEFHCKGILEVEAEASSFVKKLELELGVCPLCKRTFGDSHAH